MTYKHIIVIVALLAIVTGLSAFVKLDDDVIQKATTQLAQWVKNDPQEKVYLHLDKPYYAIGDDIWFKAYITTGSKHLPSTISNIINVELLNDLDSVTAKLRLPITAGVAWGDFKLADSLAEGNYRIRAYTNWMRNAGEAYFFDKTIQVGNSVNNTVFTNTTYTYKTQNNQQLVTAVINYTDARGNAYIAKEVDYTINLNDKQIKQGKGVTGDNGSITLTFANNGTKPFTNGNITTNIRLDIRPKYITKVIPLKATSTKIDMQFFPESGYLVNGIRSKVAFKALGADGLGVDVKGTVVDEQNNEVTQLASQHLGMGFFSITPEAGKTYTAKLIYADGTDASLPLPAANDKGYVLSVYNNPESPDVSVKISLSQSTFQESQGSEISLVAQASGTIVYAAKTKLESAVFTTHIPRTRFLSGIVQFTLFSAKGEPLNERIILVQNPDLLNLSLNTPKQVFTTREKVKLDISAKNKDGEPVIGAFSVAVIDESKVPVDETTENTILSNILLTSDIKGYVEKANYYFANINEKTQADLDVLMLTQGYRRFSWQQVINNNFLPPAFGAEKTIAIAGHVTNLDDKPIPHAKVKLLSTAGGLFILDTLADAQGKFVFNNLLFTDSVKFVLQARTPKDGKNVKIDLDNIAPQAVSKSKNTGDIEVNINTKMASYLQNSKKQYDNFLNNGIIKRGITLSEVSIAGKKNPVFSSGNLNGAGHADKIVTAEKLINCTNLIDCLPYLINVSVKSGVVYLPGIHNMGGEVPMLIVVDGIYMDSAFLQSVLASDVESVEVLKSPMYTSIYGARAAGGVLVVNMKKGPGNSDYKRYSPDMVTYKATGYHKTREFYSPQYDDVKTNAKVADLRTTIYWHPNVITDKNGSASIQFFNTDSPGTYRVVIEGIDASGNIGRQVYRYRVM